MPVQTAAQIPPRLQRRGPPSGPPAPPALRARAARPGRRWPTRPLFRLAAYLPPGTWAYLDCVLVAGLTWLARGLLPAEAGPVRSTSALHGPLATGLTFSAAIALAGLVFGLYESRTLAARSRILVRSILAAGLGLLLAHAGLFLLHQAPPRWLGPLVAGLYLAASVPLRLVAHEALTGRPRRVLFVGAGDSLRKTVALLEHGLRRHVQIVGYVGDDPPAATDPAGAAFTRSCPRLGALHAIAAVLQRHPVDEIVVGAELSADPGIAAAVLTGLEQRCRVTDQPTFIEKLLGEVPVEHIGAAWFLVADVQNGGGYEVAKRLLDVAAAAAGLAATLPLWLLIALAIRLDSHGPVFFRQCRVGRHGREFRICKFRTMRTDAEAGGARWAGRRDPRVTAVGRLLRLSRLDELPQLWNILRGDMSLVGPRPERPEFVEQLSRVLPHYRQRHLVRPGLTGWAQIHLGYCASVDEARRKLCFDLFYLKNRSLDLDVAILIRTLGTFVLGAR